MRRTTTILLISATLLGGCGTVRDSRLNPFNWFGRSSEVPAQQQAPEEVNPLIPQKSSFNRSRDEYRNRDLTTPIATVTDIKVERVPGGAIVRATGLDATQGAFNVELVPANEDEVPVEGVLTYTFERQVPQDPQPVGTEQSREVVVARALTDQQLQGVRTIRVVAAQNARQVRR
ncbi:hypothetical protein E4Z66_03280 [Aliishimia ponticola]|uniref:Lipoprotein n=1 Tax=Aliishimia ponticola TaxID=2499833 RepID=A0A4S4NG39_9RHOB|nr:hypothetical protein [Aliishimia ponticola]THH38606.1 hypothetical protein E4Z66_03280 [Aliishimia ponticola]